MAKKDRKNIPTTASAAQLLELAAKLLAHGRATEVSSEQIQWMIDHAQAVGPHFEHFLTSRPTKGKIPWTGVFESDNVVELSVGSELIDVGYEYNWLASLFGEGVHVPKAKNYVLIPLYYGAVRQADDVRRYEFLARGLRPATRYEVAYLKATMHAVPYANRTKKAAVPFVTLGESGDAPYMVRIDQGDTLSESFGIDMNLVGTYSYFVGTSMYPSDSRR